jgi:hypothetical protein
VHGPNPAPVGRWFIALLAGFHSYEVKIMCFRKERHVLEAKFEIFHHHQQKPGHQPKKTDGSSANHLGGYDLISCNSCNQQEIGSQQTEYRDT